MWTRLANNYPILLGTHYVCISLLLMISLAKLRRDVLEINNNTENNMGAYIKHIDWTVLLPLIGYITSKTRPYHTPVEVTW